MKNGCLQKIFFHEEIEIFRGFVKFQVVDFAAIDDVKASGENGIGDVIDLVGSASAKNVHDLDKIVRMAVGGDVTDIFFDQDSFLIDKMRVFFIDPHDRNSFLQFV